MSQVWIERINGTKHVQGSDREGGEEEQNGKSKEEKNTGTKQATQRPRL